MGTGHLTDESARQLVRALDTSEDLLDEVAKRVNGALDEYVESVQPTNTPAQQRKKLDQISRHLVAALIQLRGLQPGDSRLFRDSAELRLELTQGRKRLMSPRECLEALEAVLLSVRSAHGIAPRPRRGAPLRTPRWLLVNRLALIFIWARDELPKRSHNPIKGVDTGRFKDFVTVALRGLPGPELLEGIDDVIRNVCAELHQAHESALARAAASSGENSPSAGG